MRCPICKAYVPFDSKLKKCVACGAPLVKKPVMEDTLNMTAELAADKNFIFWGFFTLILGAIVGAVEFALGGGALFDYFEGHIFHSLILFMYWGFVVELVVKTNAQIRLASKTVIIKERRILRIFRLGTNLAFLGGILLSTAWIGPNSVLANFPALTLITTATVCLFWALEGMYFREEHFEDHRVRNFFILLGVRHPHPYRIISAWYISVITLALIIYWGLRMFPSIFWNFYNSGLVQSIVKAVASFLKYFPTI